jgi:hypothetical protein
MNDTLAHLLTMIGTYRLRIAREAHLQADLAEALTAEGITFLREHRFDRKSRIDFWLPELFVGIECKTDGGYGPVIRQCVRYATCDEVQGLILVSRCRSHCINKQELMGKPFRTLWVGGNHL